jgi:hypothetical protein
MAVVQLRDVGRDQLPLAPGEVVVRVLLSEKDLSEVVEGLGRLGTERHGTDDPGQLLGEVDVRHGDSFALRLGRPEPRP